MMHRQLRLAFCSKNETVNSTSGTMKHLTALPLTIILIKHKPNWSPPMNDKMTATELTKRDAAAAEAAATVERLRIELKDAEKDLRIARDRAHCGRQLMDYETRLDTFTDAAESAIAEAKVKAGMSADYPNSKLVQSIRFDVPFRQHSRDAVLQIQPHDLSKRIRTYKQNKDGGFNVSAIAALFAESKPE